MPNEIRTLRPSDIALSEEDVRFDLAGIGVTFECTEPQPYVITIQDGNENWLSQENGLIFGTIAWWEPGMTIESQVDLVEYELDDDVTVGLVGHEETDGVVLMEYGPVGDNHDYIGFVGLKGDEEAWAAVKVFGPQPVRDDIRLIARGIARSIGFHRPAAHFAARPSYFTAQHLAAWILLFVGSLEGLVAAEMEQVREEIRRMGYEQPGIGSVAKAWYDSVEPEHRILELQYVLDRWFVLYGPDDRKRNLLQMMRNVALSDGEVSQVEAAFIEAIDGYLPD
jgi:hypothetical protein